MTWVNKQLPSLSDCPGLHLRPLRQHPQVEERRLQPGVLGYPRQPDNCRPGLCLDTERLCRLNTLDQRQASAR